MNEQQDYSVSYKRFVLVMLTIVYAFNFVDRQILVMLQEPIKADLGLSDTQLGLLSGFAFAVIYVTAGIPIAYLADRRNRRNIVVVSLAIWSGMTAISGLAQNFFHLLLARIGVGLGEAGGSPPSHSMISDYYPPEQRGRALSFYSIGIYIGVLMGFLMGGALAEFFGWRIAFMVVGVPGVFFALILYFTVKEPIRGRWDGGTKVVAPGVGEAITLLRSRPGFWFIAMGSAFTTFVTYGAGNFAPSFFIRNHGFSLSEVGATLSIVVGVMGGIGTYLGGYLADRFGANDKRWYLWVASGGTFLAMPLYAAYLLSDTAVMAIGFLALAQVCITMYLGPCIAASHMVVPPAMRALVSAVLFFVLNMIGLGMGPVFTGLASDMLSASYGEESLRYAMLLTVGVGVLAPVMFYFAAKKLPADIAKV